MKKILVFLAAAFMCLATVSCNKDNDVYKNYYRDAVSIENVNYGIDVYQTVGDLYNWTISNSTSEVSVKYTFTYDEKKAIRLDFEEIKAVVDGIIDEDVNIERVFVHEFRYLNDDPKEAEAHISVNAGQVVVHFVVGNKEFAVPYRFITGVVNSLRPVE